MSQSQSPELQQLQDMKQRPQVATFLLKTYEMLENSSLNHIISWSQNGQSFVVFNQKELANKVFPNYFKHKNYASFLRQLNLYNFKKSKNEFNQNEFRHKWFRKGLKSLLVYIRRRNQEEVSEKININLSESEVDNYRFEHEEIKKIIKLIEESQVDIEKSFNEVMEQNSNLQNYMNNIQSQQKSLDAQSVKKFERLAIIISKIVSGIEHKDLQQQMNELFTQALLGEDNFSSGTSNMNFREASPYFEKSVPNQLAIPNNIIQLSPSSNFASLSPPTNLIPMSPLYSGNNSPYSIEFNNPFHTILMNQLYQQKFSNIFIDPLLFQQFHSYPALSPPPQPILAIANSPYSYYSPNHSNLSSPFRNSSANQSPARQNQNEV